MDPPENLMGGTLVSAMLWDQIPADPILSMWEKLFHLSHQNIMKRIELQRLLYHQRNAYLKAKHEMEFHAKEIQFLNQCIKELGATDLYDELFANA